MDLLGGLWSSSEFTVDPRQIIQSLPGFLEERYNVQFFFGTAVTAIDHPCSYSGDGQWHAETVIVCTGDDFETLYPRHFAASGLTRCKLQMMRTSAQPNGWQLGPSLAAGLTLRFYPAFQVCTTLPALSRRIAEETPEFDRWGIHALVSQTADGALTLGDSHEYGLSVDIFNKEEIDEIILRSTRQFLRAPDLTVAERWYGVYAKHPEKPLLVMQPEDGVRIVAFPGGSGMTLSFGVAEKSIRALGFIHAWADAKIPAVFLDWAGTAVDHGSIAPVNALEDIFHQYGVTVPRPLVRRHMGLAKKDHIRKLLEEPYVQEQWTAAASSAPARA